MHAHVEQERPELCRIGSRKVSQSPTTVVTANGEVQTKEEAKVYVKELDFFVTVKLVDDTPASHSENSSKISDIPTSGPVVRNHNSSKMAERWNAIRRTAYHSLFLVYRQALQAHLHLHLHRRKPYVTPTKHPASTRSVSMSDEVRGDSSHGPAGTENQNKNDDNEEVRGEPLRNLPGLLKEFKETWWMKVFQNTETLPVLPMNYLQSREPKWYRVSIAS